MNQFLRLGQQPLRRWRSHSTTTFVSVIAVLIVASGCGRQTISDVVATPPSTSAVSRTGLSSPPRQTSPPTSVSTSSTASATPGAFPLATGSAGQTRDTTTTTRGAAATLPVITVGTVAAATAPVPPPPTVRPATTTTPEPLRISLSEAPFGCDGSARAFGTVSNAWPSEPMLFTASGASLRSANADSDGSVTIHWRCDPSDASRAWALTATGANSGRTATVEFSGKAAATTTTTSTTTTAAANPKSLDVSFSENPFACDNQRRPFGSVFNASPGETVTFVADGIGDLLPGTADNSGRVTINWRCQAWHVDTTWKLTATGQTSGRTVTFSFSGRKATP